MVLEVLLEVAAPLIASLVPVHCPLCASLVALLNSSHLCLLGVADANHTKTAVCASELLLAAAALSSFNGFALLAIHIDVTVFVRC
jgi:hypothetical protein